MRARGIQPAFYKSDQLAECSISARYIFPGLWMMADRKGRLEYRPKKIKAELMPFDNCEIEPLLSELAANDLIKIYEVDGGKYIWIPTFNKHQHPHQNEVQSHYPAHPLDKSEDSGCSGQTTSSPGSDQTCSTSHQGNKSSSITCGQGTKHSSANPADSLIPDSLIPDNILNTSCSELDKTSSPPSPKPHKEEAFISLPVIGGGMYPVTCKQVEIWTSLYPAVDVQQQLRSMFGWLDSHPRRRKTRTGMKSFITSWLSKEQNNSRLVGVETRRNVKTFAELEEERFQHMLSEAEKRDKQRESAGIIHDDWSNAHDE